MDLRLMLDRPTEAEKEAVDALVGPPERFNGRVAYGGHAARAQRQLLIPALHAVQDASGSVSRGALSYICDRLTIPPAEAWDILADTDHLNRIVGDRDFGLIVLVDVLERAVAVVRALLRELEDAVARPVEHGVGRDRVGRRRLRRDAAAFARRMPRPSGDRAAFRRAGRSRALAHARQDLGRRP